MTDRELIEKALLARESAYTPYSHHKVGAALLTAEGEVFTGCNIENAAFGPTVCAERTAIFKAVSEGRRNFVKIAVAGGPEGEVTDYCRPCGVCRQVMTEFCTPEFEIIAAINGGDYVSTTLGELLPHSFSPENLK